MAGSKRHILVVDDNEFNREILVQNLEDLGYGCMQASDGDSALGAIERSAPSLVLLDVMMPDMDGVEVCRRLRSQPGTNDLPVIMVTAKTDSSDVVAGLKAGANDYVTKPVDMDVLLARIETHLRLRELQEQARRSNERLLRELEAARSVQESLLPNEDKLAELPNSYGLRVAAVWQPCAMLGGDFWDVVALADGSLGLFLADFAGTGVVPSLNTFRIKSFLQAQCVGVTNAELAMIRLNHALHDMLGFWELALCLYARYSPERRRFGIVAAGAPSPLVIRGAMGVIERVPSRGLPAGAFLDAAWDEAVVDLNPGDKIVFYSDGLTKMQLENGNLLTDERLADFLSLHGGDSAGMLTEAIRTELLGADSRISRSGDDVTVVVCEVIAD